MTIKETTPAAEQFLSERRNIILATIRKDGRPQLTPVWFVWRNNEFLISTTPSTAKWNNLVRDQRCTGMIDDLDGRYLSVAGTTELWTESDPHTITSEIVRKYKTAEEYEPYMEIIRSDRPERGIIRMKPDRIITRGLD
ncbi:MAG: PPOX class F420-dependent oxidoreductase [Chloroflexi bacterium]|nr:PPOX class F420-dependent oxidoreductase [Chloroflexota bacterium]